MYLKSFEYSVLLLYITSTNSPNVISTSIEREKSSDIYASDELLVNTSFTTTTSANLVYSSVQRQNTAVIIYASASLHLELPQHQICFPSLYKTLCIETKQRKDVTNDEPKYSTSITSMLSPIVV